MAINRYTPTTSIPQLVSHTNGTFTIDCSTGTNFLLDLSNGDFERATQTLTYVGGKTFSLLGTTTTTNISLTDLSGGAATAPAQNDIVIVAYAVGSTANRDLSVTGYTELADLYTDDTDDTNLGVYYKIMTSTPDTSITISQTGNIDFAGAVAIHVWRNIDTTNPMDVTISTATTANAASANPPSITTVTPNAVVLAIGASGNSEDGDSFLQGGDLTNFITIGSNDTEDVSIGMGSIITTQPGRLVDPNAFSITESANSSWAAVTLALRPVTISAGLTTATIDLTNPTTLRSDINIDIFYKKFYSYTSDLYTLTLSWDSAIKEIVPLQTYINTNSNLSYNLYTQNGKIFVYEKASLAKSLVEKTEIITSTQNWTAPLDVSRIEVLLCGGGASGDGSTVTDGRGGHGSAINSFLNVVPGVSYLITIGAGGAVPALAADNGISGSASSFGSLLSVSGGIGGVSGDKAPGGVGGSPGSESYYPSFVGFSNIYGKGGFGNNSTVPAERKIGGPNTGSGGSVGRAGGSGVCIIKYRSAS